MLHMQKIQSRLSDEELFEKEELGDLWVRFQMHKKSFRESSQSGAWVAESVKERGQLKYYFHHKSVAWQISNTLYSGKLQRKHCYDRKIAYVMMPVS